jgi:hypothetical protein
VPSTSTLAEREDDHLHTITSVLAVQAFGNTFNCTQRYRLVTVFRDRHLNIHVKAVKPPMAIRPGLYQVLNDNMMISSSLRPGHESVDMPVALNAMRPDLHGSCIRYVRQERSRGFRYFYFEGAALG